MRIMCNECRTLSEVDTIMYWNGCLLCPNCKNPLTGEISEGFRCHEPEEEEK